MGATLNSGNLHCFGGGMWKIVIFHVKAEWFVGKSVGKSAPRGNCISRANSVGMKRSLLRIEENASPALRAAGGGAGGGAEPSRADIEPTSTI